MEATDKVAGPYTKAKEEAIEEKDAGSLVADSCGSDKAVGFHAKIITDKQPDHELAQIPPFPD